MEDGQYGRLPPPLERRLNTSDSLTGHLCWSSQSLAASGSTRRTRALQSFSRPPLPSRAFFTSGNACTSQKLLSAKFPGCKPSLLIPTANNSHHKSWKLTGLYVFCAVLFTAGFIVREMGAFDYANLVKYIIATCLVYAAPYVFPSALSSSTTTHLKGSEVVAMLTRLCRCPTGPSSNCATTTSWAVSCTTCHSSRLSTRAGSSPRSRPSPSPSSHSTATAPR